MANQRLEQLPQSQSFQQSLVASFLISSNDNDPNENTHRAFSTPNTTTVNCLTKESILHPKAKSSKLKAKLFMAGHNKWTQIKRQKEVVDKKKSKIFSILARTLTLEAKAAKGDQNSPGLKKAIEKARAANVPSENIERAINGASGAGIENFENVLYEAYGPGGVALIIHGITSNKNRTSQEIKHLLSEHGASLAPQGSVTWAFIKTNTGWQPNNLIDLAEAEQIKMNLLRLALENHDDIEHVYDNCRH